MDGGRYESRLIDNSSVSRRLFMPISTYKLAASGGVECMRGL